MRELTIKVTDRDAAAIRRVLALANSAAPGYLSRRIEEEGRGLMDLEATAKSYGQDLAAVGFVVERLDAMLADRERAAERVEKVAEGISAEVLETRGPGPGEGHDWGSSKCRRCGAARNSRQGEGRCPVAPVDVDPDASADPPA